MEIIAFSPGESYPTISITGTTCALGCLYCQGYYLKNMHSAMTPADLYSTVRNLHAKGARGILISGGFNKDGLLPVRQFLPTIKKIKKDFDLLISLHPGLVDKVLATEIRMSNIDIVDYELIIDPFVIRGVKGLNKSPLDYIKSLKFLTKFGPAYIVPHLLIGLRYGAIAIEKETIDSLLDYDPYLVTFLTFIPTRNTSMANCNSPEKEDLIELFSYARKLRGEIALGCMRPQKYKDDTEHLLIEKRLIDRIAVPSYKIVKKYNLNIIKACCSMPREFLPKFVDQ